MSEHNHLISVVIPCYNEGAYISDALESILNQSHESFEVIIVDDGSTDNTVQIIDKYDDSRLHLVKNRSNRGRSAARNKGLDRASGDFIIFHDADDLSHKDRFALQLDRFTNHPQLICVGALAEAVDQNGCCVPSVPQRPPQIINTTYLMTHCQPILTPACMFRTNVVANLGGFREEFVRSEDCDFWLRLIESYGSENIDTIFQRLYSRRITPENSWKAEISAFYADYARRASRRRISGHSDESVIRELVSESGQTDFAEPDPDSKVNYYYYRLGKMAIQAGESGIARGYISDSFGVTKKSWLLLLLTFLPGTIARIVIKWYNSLMNIGRVQV